LQLHRLTDDQAFTLKAALSGHNVFITGQAGTGKSFLVKEIFQQLEHVVAVLLSPVDFFLKV